MTAPEVFGSGVGDLFLCGRVITSTSPPSNPFFFPPSSPSSSLPPDPSAFGPSSNPSLAPPWLPFSPRLPPCRPFCSPSFSSHLSIIAFLSRFRLFLSPSPFLVWPSSVSPWCLTISPSFPSVPYPCLLPTTLALHPPLHSL
jgi:hypothetical protein